MIKQVGNWVSAAKLWGKKVTETLADKAMLPMSDLGEAIAVEVKRGIAQRKIEGPPLAASTIAKKGHDHPLIEKGRYIASIGSKAQKFPFGSRILVKVVVAPNRKQEALIGFWHEYGTSKFPARPHWRPAMARIKSDPAMKRLLEGKWFELDFQVRS